MSSTSDRFVILRGGLTVPIDPLLLLLDLEARGFTVARDGDDLSVRPRAQLTDQDRARLRQWKPDVLALLDYEPPSVQ